MIESLIFSSQSLHRKSKAYSYKMIADAILHTGFYSETLALTESSELSKRRLLVTNSIREKRFLSCGLSIWIIVERKKTNKKRTDI